MKKIAATVTDSTHRQVKKLAKSMESSDHLVAGALIKLGIAMHTNDLPAKLQLPRVKKKKSRTKKTPKLEVVGGKKFNGTETGRY